MALKLLKFDIIHPHTYLVKKQAEWDDLDELSLNEYRNRLIALRSNYSDFYTHYLNELGWEAEEFFLLDEVFLQKVAEDLLGKWAPLHEKGRLLLQKIRPRRWNWKQWIIRAYVEQFNPDVIFARSQPMASSYWQKFRDDTLLVARLSAQLPRNWHPYDWDLIYADLDTFKAFFETHNVPTRLNDQGFDPRIIDELKPQDETYEVTFVGGMGTENFYRRTQLFEKIAGEINFKWWGYWWKYGGWGSLDDFPNLKKSFQGPISGLEMYQIHKNSKIVLNDYVDIDIRDNIGFNQRMFEAMGVGGFMLTRQAENFAEQFPNDIFATFTDAVDCVKKIKYYLNHPQERDQISQRARQFVEEKYHYKDIVREFDQMLRKELSKK